MFRARLPSIFSTSHKMQRMPWNLHVVTTWGGPDNAIRKNTQHNSSKVLPLPHKMKTVTSKVPRLPTKTATHLLKTSQEYCACHTKRLSTRYKTRLNVTKCHACHAKRGYAACETSKSDPCCRTCHRHGHSDLARSVADGCERLRNVERTHPQPPEWNGNPCSAFGKNKEN